jgi:hypothetical protein
MRDLFGTDHARKVGTVSIASNPGHGKLIQARIRTSIRHAVSADETGSGSMDVPDGALVRTGTPTVGG